jgi:subtilisin family serine protease
MATPHVAGVAALLLQAKPSATVDELEQAIFSSCRLPSGMLQERGNRGIPDAVVAFTRLTGQPPVATGAMASPKRRRASRSGARRAGRVVAAPKRARPKRKRATAALASAAKKGRRGG